MSNVNLWFARNDDNEIVTIHSSTKENNYTCPICGSEVKPKALTSKKVSPHFAHVDVSKCNSESMIHWWFKHKFIAEGDSFSITTDEKIEYVCKSIEVEKEFPLESGIYRPDLIVHTECGETVVFEMANTNKKMVKDYIDRWIELDKVVVEVNIKDLNSIDEDKNFKALYYKGKCFNFNKRDGGYYDTIGRLKETMMEKDRYDLELVQKLDWFWNELLQSKETTNLEDLFISLTYVSGYLDNKSLFKICKNHNLLVYKENYDEWVLEQVKNTYVKSLSEKLIDFCISVKSYSFSDEITPRVQLSINKLDNKISVLNYINNLIPSEVDIINFYNETLKLINNEEYRCMYEYLKDKNDVHGILGNYNFNDTDEAKVLNNKLANAFHKNILVRFFVREGESQINIKLKFYAGRILKKIGEIDTSCGYQKLKTLDDVLYKEAYDFLNEYRGLFDKYHEIISLNSVIDKLDDYNIDAQFVRGDVIRLDSYVTTKHKSNRSIFKGEYTVNDILNLIINDFNKDKCINCNDSINIKDSEFKFFLNKGLHLPKRCKSCRNKRKKGASAI